MISKETTIGEILRINSKAAEVLRSFGMGCLGCPSAITESLAEACLVHDLDINEVLNKLNDEEYNL